MRKSSALAAFFVVFSLGFCVAAAPQSETKVAGSSTAPAIDQSLELKAASTPQISPDGKRITYEVTRTNWEDNAFERDLWIVDTATGESHQLTTSKKSSSGALWSPDGKCIAFLSDRPGQIPGSPADKKQIYLMSADGGEARQLTKVEKGVNNFDWSKDSRKIAFTAEDPESKAAKDRKEKYGEYEIVHGDYPMVHLWSVEIPAPESEALPEPKRLTDGAAFSVGDFEWSPDGTKIAFSAQRDPDLISLDSADVYVVTVADGKVEKIVDTPGPDRNPHWSPDGKQIAYNTAAGSKFFFYTNSKIAVVNADGGTARVLTDAFDEDPGLIAWRRTESILARRRKPTTICSG